MIKLTVVSYNNQASPAPMSAVFGKDGGNLGRSEGNYFVLPDPKNLVSRIQASVKSDGTRHTIVNLSQSNAILLNGTEISFNREYTFNAGDEFQIGLYLLRAEPHLAAIDGNAAVERMPNSAHASTTELRAVPLPPRHAPVGHLRQLDTGRVLPNLAELHKKASEGTAPHGKQAAAGLPPPSLSSAESDRSQQPASPAALDHSHSTSGDDALMHAFLRGAGIPNINVNTALTPEFMEMLGKLLSTSIRGTFQLLASRSSIKREARADVTMVVVRNNNPLKFLSDSETVLMQMLRKKMPGFMAPHEALQDAFEDLQAHQSGMIAGMNGAIREVLDQLAPQTINAGVKRSFLDVMLRQRRKARLWGQYELVFDDIESIAQQDYQTLFGKAFLKAYEKGIEQEIERLHDAMPDE